MCPPPRPILAPPRAQPADHSCVGIAKMRKINARNLEHLAHLGLLIPHVDPRGRAPAYLRNRFAASDPKALK